MFLLSIVSDEAITKPSRWRVVYGKETDNKL